MVTTKLKLNQFKSFVCNIFCLFSYKVHGKSYVRLIIHIICCFLLLKKYLSSKVADLAQASPATVSRCGMVYIDPNEMGYLPFVRSWLQEGVEKNLFNQENSDFIYELFKMTQVGLDHVNYNCGVGIKQVNVHLFI